MEQHQLRLRADELIEERVGGVDVLVLLAGDAHPDLRHHRLAAGGEVQGRVLLLEDLADTLALSGDALQPGADGVLADQDPPAGAQPYAFGAQGGEVRLHVSGIVTVCDGPAQRHGIRQHRFHPAHSFVTYLSYHTGDPRRTQGKRAES